MTKANDLFESVTNRLVALIENAEEENWDKPWKAIFGHGIPTNVVTKKQYQGFNTFAFMLERFEHDYTSDLWGTYKQWQSIDAQVRKGQKGTYGVKWGSTFRCDPCKHKGQKRCGKEGHVNGQHWWASVFTVFNADQVDGYEPPQPDASTAPERIEAIEGFVAATGVNVIHQVGDRAFYKVGTNDITIPERAQFSTVEGYYGTLFHEMTHWSGDDSRLGRDQFNKFGSHAYAAEELVAEFGSAYLAAHFGVEPEPHINHAAYLKSWVTVLRDDPTHLYRAAKLAQVAANWLLSKVAVSDEESVAA